MDRTPKQKEPVRLRQKKLANGNASLYLDTYYEGRRSYEFLKLYLIPEVTKRDRVANKNTLALADTIRAQRIVELQKEAHGFGRAASSVSVYDFMDRRIRSAGMSESTNRTWGRVKDTIKLYDQRNDLKFDRIDRAWVQGYVRYLSGRGLKNNSIGIYLSKLKACLHEAMQEGVIAQDPAAGISVRAESAKRMYLTVEEVRALVNTPPPEHAEGMRNAFLFSCLTGLRSSDIKKLTWGEVYEQNGLTRIIFSQKKTGGLEYLDINPQAAKLMGGRCGHRDNDAVFPDYDYKKAIYYLGRWCRAAGITKHITFHCARHTFATMMLTTGADIYTVSKLLGHSDISTTQIYAEIIDSKKREAVGNIPELL